MTKLTHDDWLRTGLDALARTGPAGLKIAALCRRARMTRGSFYHHFADQKAYCTALLDYWVHTHTEAIIAAVDRSENSAQARRHELSRQTARLDSQVEEGIRRWAANDPVAAAALRRVDTRRVDYLADLNAAEFGLDPAAARDLARIEYAVFLGYPQADPGADEREVLRVSKTFDRMMRAYAASSGRAKRPGS